MPFITFEGIDGAGKSTLISSLAAKLKGQGHTVELTREPGGSPLGDRLRQLLLSKDDSPPVARAELLMYMADRAQHVATVIKPWLKKNVWVLCDRYADSSLAFQGAGRGISADQVNWLNEFATESTKPELTILVDCPVDVAERRQKHRLADRMESEAHDFHEMVRNAYLRLARSDTARFLIIDATKKSEDMMSDVWKDARFQFLLTHEKAKS